ncbi:HD domain-containing protein [Candidatus Woesearchaeota archaeon]|nr:HD domain-containing protein [Candidatus Woesearchaeota archaeon]
MQPTILIAEGNNSHRQLYTTQFDNNRYSLLFAGDGKEVLQTILSQHPDIVLFDSSLPDMPNTTVIEQIIAQFNDGFPYLPHVVVNSAEGAVRKMLERKEPLLSAGDSVRIETILHSNVSPDYEIARIITVPDKSSGAHLLALRDVIQDVLQSPRYVLVREVKELIHELGDSPENIQYRSQLESFLHEFLFLNIKFRVLRDMGLTARSENALFAYRTLVEEHMPTLRWHSRDTAEYSITLARMMGLESDEIDQLRYAGYYHDIGQLPAREFYSMSEVFSIDDKRRKFLPLHPRTGRILLEALGVTDTDLLALVESHHANYNGSGYPTTFFRDSIPMHGILRIAEMIDSVKRKKQHIPDDQRMPLEADSIAHIKQELHRYGGTFFNPDAANTALRYLDAYHA